MVSLADFEVPAGEPARLLRVPPPAVAWALLLVAALVGEALSLRPILVDAERPVAGIDVVLTLVGGSFAVCGLIAWRRRPDNRSWVLMTATGFLFYVSPLLAQIDGRLAATLLVLLVDLWLYTFVALLLTFLSGGVLQTRLDRLLVGAYAVPLVLGQILWMMFDPNDGHLLLAWPDADVAWVIDRMQRALLGGISVVAIVVVVARWLGATAPRRRALLPSLAGAFTLLMFTILAVDGLIGGTSTPAVHWAAACSFALVPLAFLAGLLRSRLARGGLAELLRGLGTMSAEEMEQALRRALGDPGLALVLDTAPQTGRHRTVTPVERSGRRVASIVHERSLEDDPELLEAAAAATAVALENRQLLNEADDRLAELKASRERIVAAGDAERRRLERNLHDGAQQRLVAIALQLRLLERRFGDDPSAAQALNNASAELAESLSELRELARGLHPAVLEHGLPAALNSLASRATVATTVSCDLTQQLSQPVELAAYFVAAEALANVAKYSQATRATVRAWTDDGHATIEIADNGIGGADGSRGSGLRGLTDRVQALDGSLSIHSPAGAGTTITAKLPRA